MPLTVQHVLTATTPDDPAYEIRPSHWNSDHLVNVSLASDEVIKFISAGTNSVSSGTIVFSNSNGVSFGMDVNGVITATVNPGAAAGIAAFGAGTQTATSGTIVFANSNGVTFGMSNSSQITMDFASSRFAGTGFTSTTTAGTEVKATNSTNGLSMAMPAFLTTAQPPGAYLTTARASNDAIGLDTALTANGVSMTANSSGLSLNFPAFLTTAALSNHSHGNPTLNLTNLSGTTASNSAGFTLSLSAGAGGAGDGGNILAAGTRTAGSNSTVLFSNANGATWGLDAVNGSVMTIDFGSSSLAGTGFTSTTTAGTQVKATNSTNGLSMAMPAFLTTAALSQNTSNYAGLGFTSTTTVGTGVNGTLSTNGLSMAFPAWLTTAARSQDSSNYAGLGTTFNGANISGSMTMNTNGLQLSMSVAAAGGGGTAVTMYATSNTTQSSTGTQALSSLMFAGAGVASVGISNGSVVISVPSGGGAGDGGNIVSMLTSTSGGGTAGATYSNSVASIGLMAGSNITLSQTSNTINIVAPNASSLVGTQGINISTAGSTISIVGGNVMFMSLQPRQLGVSGSTQFTNNQIWMIPFRIAGGTLSASTLQYMQSLSGTFTSAVAATHAETMKWAIYSEHATNLSRFDSASSGSFTWQVWNSGTSSGSYAINGSTSSSAGTGIMTQAAGVRMMQIPINLSITNGLYLMAFAQSTSSAGYSALFSRYGVVVDNPVPLAMGQNFGAATATSIGYVDAGSYGTTSAAFPSSCVFTDIKQHSNIIPYFKMGAV